MSNTITNTNLQVQDSENTSAASEITNVWVRQIREGDIYIMNGEIVRGARIINSSVNEQRVYNQSEVREARIRALDLEYDNRERPFNQISMIDPGFSDYFNLGLQDSSNRSSIVSNININDLSEVFEESGVLAPTIDQINSALNSQTQVRVLTSFYFSDVRERVLQLNNFNDFISSPTRFSFISFNFDFDRSQNIMAISGFIVVLNLVSPAGIMYIISQLDVGLSANTLFYNIWRHMSYFRPFYLRAVSPLFWSSANFNDLLLALRRSAHLVRDSRFGISPRVRGSLGSFIRNRLNEISRNAALNIERIHQEGLTILNNNHRSFFNRNIIAFLGSTSIISGFLALSVRYPRRAASIITSIYFFILRIFGPLIEELFRDREIPDFPVIPGFWEGVLDRILNNADHDFIILEALKTLSDFFL